MPKQMLIDAAHPEETRVVVLDGHRVDDFDFETAARRQLRGNIYLAKVTRVEPSLQAAFVEYGGNRHGFLAFGEIHPDYYQIPIADREALKAEVEAAASSEGADGDGDEEDENAEEERRRRILTRRYKIQEVIRRRQIMLIQVVKEERGNKGAALTTYLSMAGRYCVLMPNTGSGGGISRKITAGVDRKRLKKVATDLAVPPGMGLIIRTAGAKRTKTEIRRDYDYLLRAWENIRETTMKSIAPALIYEESSLVKRAIRDLYDKEVDEIYVEGEGAYREAKDFIRMLMPSHAKKVHLHREPVPLFVKHSVERQLESIYNPIVHLKSGGYLVINQTEALVAIDVNSGRSTRERNIEATAFKTNLEAADEAAHQMRLRDLAGLIVIDFIDMEDAKNDRIIEKRVKDALRFDRSRVQVGKISSFGLLELSRQRRRTGVLEGTSHTCALCSGSGRVRSVESSALRMLRALDEEIVRANAAELEIRAPADVVLYVLNEKREMLTRMEQERHVRVRLTASTTLVAPDFEIQAMGNRADALSEDGEDVRPAPAAHESDRGRRHAPAQRRPEPVYDEPTDEDSADEEETLEAGPSASGVSDSDRNRRRRRGRRGGKRRNEGENGEALGSSPEAAQMHRPVGEKPASADGERGGRRRRRRRSRPRRLDAALFDGGEATDFLLMDLGSVLPMQLGADDGFEGGPDEDALEAAPAAPVIEEVEPVAALAPKRTRRTPAKAAALPPIDPTEMVPEPSTEPAASPIVQREDPAPPPAPASIEAPPIVMDMPPPLLPEPVQYEVDAERREKFLARISRWGKKA
jgi:ribonuclease E